jgi:Fic family protein
VISEAIEALREYLREKTKEISDARRLSASSPQLNGKLNHRQLAAMDYFRKHSHVTYRIQEHQSTYQVTYQTARTDLLDLVAMALLEKHREGRAFVFQMPQKLRKKLAVRSSARDA